MLPESGYFNSHKTVRQKGGSLDAEPRIAKAAFCRVPADSAGARPGELPLERLAAQILGNRIHLHEFVRQPR